MMTGSTALQDRVAALEAERLAPVPRASHAVGVNVDDLALVLHYVRATRPGDPGARRAAEPMSGDAIAACHRLEAAVAGHPAREGAR
jgi:hypothetical protein